MKEHVFEARDFLAAPAARPAKAARRRRDRAASPARSGARDRRAGAARRRPRDRARAAARRARSPGRLLGDMGAEIIKVEPPGQPDPIRDWGKARYEGRSLWWPVQSRNKKCVTLNLRAERGQELLLELVEQADVLDRELPPGHAREVEPRLGAALGGEPELVLARVSGYGQTGPVRRSGRASRRSPRRWAASATSTAFPASRRRACTSRSATRSPACSPSQGILAALYRRDALGGGRGPGRRRLAARGVLRAAREHGARVRPARDRPRARAARG